MTLALKIISTTNAKTNLDPKVVVGSDPPSQLFTFRQFLPGIDNSLRKVSDVKPVVSLA